MPSRRHEIWRVAHAAFSAVRSPGSLCFAGADELAARPLTVTAFRLGGEQQRGRRGVGWLGGRAASQRALAAASQPAEKSRTSWFAHPGHFGNWQERRVSNLGPPSLALSLTLAPANHCPSLSSPSTTTTISTRSPACLSRSLRPTTADRPVSCFPLLQRLRPCTPRSATTPPARPTD